MTKKISVKLTEMKDADVRFVSLVDRSASRIPFRVIKADKENVMGINLGNIGRILKGEKTAPTQKAEVPKTEVTAVVVFDHGGDVGTAVEGALKDAGFAVDKITKNEDGTQMYAQVDNPMEGGTLVKLSDEVLVVVKGFDSYKPQADFNDVLAARGFLPGISAATDALYSSVCTSLYSAADQSELATKVDEITKKFSTHVLGLAKALPANVFKMDEAVVDAVAKGEKKKPAEGTPMEEGKEKPEDEAKEKAKDGDESKEKAKEAPAKKSEEETVVKTEAEAEKTPAAIASPELTAMLNAITALSDSVKELTAKVDSVSTTVAEVSVAQKTTEQKVAEVAQKADTATNAVKNTILAAPQAGDEPAQGQQKVETAKADPRSGNFDTAFLRRSK